MNISLTVVLIVLVAVAIICGIIGFHCGRNKANVERISENNVLRELENQKQNQLIEVEGKIASAIKTLDDVNKQIVQQNIDTEKRISELNWRATIAQTDLERHLDRVKDDKFAKINKAAIEYRRKKYDEIQDAIHQQETDFILWKEELSSQLTKVENEINVLRSSRDAFIEAARREEEKKLQQDYYKITLTEENFNDIKLLKSIEKFLFNKDPLYKLIWNTFYMAPTKEMLNRIIGKEKSCGIYKITNEINSKVYIGQSVDLHSRLTNHIKAALGIGTIAHQQVHDAMAAEGLENFSFEIVEKCSKEQLNKKEKLWIETYASDKYGYNRTAGGAKEE